MQVSVTTTFPLSYLDLCAKEMLASFDKYWPKEVDLYIKLDRVPEKDLVAFDDWMKANMSKERAYFIANNFSPEQVKFLETHHDQGDNYRLQAVRFSYKVFALHDTLTHINDSNLPYEKLIWLDADVITHSPITPDDIDQFLPNEYDTSHLGRMDAPHSECGFVGYNLKGRGGAIIERMAGCYIGGELETLPGFTDCDVYDHVIKSYNAYNLSAGIHGWHVFPQSILGKFMEHRKGNRKITKEQPVLPKTPPALSNLQVRTRNCVEPEVIREQVATNISKIRNWAAVCKPNDEEIVIASAGPSLNPEDIMPFYKAGVKIVAVKHAMERLKEWGIKPWACVLLDPRPHVEGFVTEPDKEVIYFVSSMVHPSVVDQLNKNKCKVIGYHAHVGVDFKDILISKDLLVSGGSATSTRCIGLLSDFLGFRKFHCFGYDLCHYHKPDHTEKTVDGQPKYLEVELSCKTWGGKDVHRTFWTEGQFLAQAKEMSDLYKSKQKFTMVVYGDGIAGWEYRHHQLHKKWSDQYMDGLDDKRLKSINVNEWLNGLT